MKLLLILSSIALCSSKEVAKRDLFAIGIEAERQVPIGREYWNCGGEKWTEDLAYIAMGNTCPDRMPEINQCCAVHDDCYGMDHLSRKICDTAFCDCIRKTTSGNNRHQTQCGMLTTDVGCKAVNLFGSLFYKTPSGGIAKRHYPILNSTAVYFYQKLYEKCRNIDKTLLSCAYNHIICHLQLLPSEAYNQTSVDCKNQLYNCLENDVDFLQIENKKCMATLKNVLNAITDDEDDSKLGHEVIMNSTILELADELANLNIAEKEVSIDSNVYGDVIID